MGGCSTEVELVAPEARERLVVYGILRTDSDSQYIRIGRLFVTRANALEYASQNNLSIKARVRLKDELGQEWVAIPETVEKIPSQPFYPIHTVYRFNMRPVPRRRYFLYVEVPENSSLNVEAATTVPSPPYLARPESVVYLGPTPSYPSIDLTKKVFFTFFAQYEANLPVLAAGYELTFFFHYGKVVAPGDTQRRTFWLGPIRVPHQPTTRAQTYTFAEKALLRQVYASIQPESGTFVYDASPLSQAWGLDLTAVDTALYQYLRANDPATTDFTTVKPEYTNVRNGLGVFGSAAPTRRYFRIDPCSEYLLRLNNAPRPYATCNLD